MMFVMAVVYLSSTPLATNFVVDFLPKRLLLLPYFEHMDQWFPNFETSAPEKGGVGFSKPAGHSFMDFMSYLSLRLSFELFETKKHAWDIFREIKTTCGYKVYETISSRSLTHFEFA